ncbi:MAG: DUF1015 family protein [Candidatus Thermoplasmatota archaeon]|jgi:uncharacterized protein (DUF1015 family)|nr:DUF1015 family protein [Candidatus Thermoplasmatota archaeon]MCL5794603.1 DUF1015 family protein [Candidatus Thermoplasmatota archaeon]
MRIKPFKPLIYQGNISTFIAPPFDTILKPQEDDLKKNRENIVHLTLPAESDGMGTPRQIIDRWISEGRIKRPDRDVVLLVSQEFSYANQNLQRLGIIALAGIYPIDGTVKPHEKTFDGPRKGRMQLMSTLGCQPEPIFLLVSSSKFEKLLRSALQTSARLFSFEEPLNVVNKVYLIEDQAVIEEIRSSLDSENSIVADGHHRLAATQALADMSDGNAREFWSYSMAYITSVHDPGLLIAGIHRIVKTDIPNKDWATRIQEYFEVETRSDFTKSPGLILYDGQYRCLKIRKDVVSPLLPAYAPDTEVPLTAIVNEIILTRCLGLSEVEIERNVLYTNDLAEAIRSVDGRTAAISLIMPPWEKENFIKVVLKNQILPQKSTYFYPKIPSGIAINCMDH